MTVMNREWSVRCGILMALALSVGVSAGCHQSTTVSTEVVEHGCYPRLSSQRQHIAMAAGDMIGWHLATAEMGHGIIVSDQGMVSTRTNRPPIDPFTRHSAVGTNTPTVDPLAP